MTVLTGPYRQRDKEIAALRASLAERDSKLHATRSDVSELHAQLHGHETGLQQAYNQLAEASRDKARVRQQLLENQAELSGVSVHHSMSGCRPKQPFALLKAWAALWRNTQCSRCCCLNLQQICPKDHKCCSIARNSMLMPLCILPRQLPPCSLQSEVQPNKKRCRHAERSGSSAAGEGPASCALQA